MELINRDECFGCGACMSICPRHAISAKLKDGFSYPVIDQNLCINCGLCKRACPAENYRQSEHAPKLYAFRHTDLELVEDSSSGAVFTALSDRILAQGGAIIGAVMDEDNVVRHHLTGEASVRDKMRGAKYVQSDLNGTLEAAAKLLRSSETPLLFTGTPCQAEAFRTYCTAAGLDLTNVIICALVCHGAPSPLIWKHWLEAFLRKIPGETVVLRFRDKEQGWRSNKMTAVVDGKSYSMETYANLFYSKLGNQRACFTCPFTTPMRNCDITLGDFWSIQHFDEGFAEKKGVSMLLAHTDKGDKLIRQCAADGELKQIAFDPAEDILQPALTSPYQKPVEYEQFWKDFQKLDFSALVRKYTGKSPADRVRRFLRRKMLKILQASRSDSKKEQ